MVYPGTFNSSYHPSPLEELYINTPKDQLGPVETGQILVAVLQGMMIVQYNQYLNTFWNEKRWTKWLVHLIFILCLAKFGYVWYFGWDRFVLHYGDWLYLATFTPSAVPIGISSTIPSAVCQMFYIHRCWALSRNLFFTIPAALALLLTVASGIALTYGAALAAGGDVAITNMILISINISLASGLACDVFITTFTCYHLVRERTGFKETDNLVLRLVKCSVESALGPTVFALINLILSNRATDNQWFLVPNLALSHVYGCSLLYTVNARKSIAMGSQVSVSLTRSNPPSRSTDFPLQTRSRGAKSEVFVEVQTVVRPDSSVIPQQRSGGTRDSQDGDSCVVSRDKTAYYI